MTKENLLNQIEFFEKLGHMLSCGVPVLRSLEILARELNDGTLRPAIHAIVENLKRADGKQLPFWASFAKNIFSESTLAMIEAGESRGELDYVCIRIANCLRAQLTHTCHSSRE
jgi:type II secretory pathway component PulF